VSIEYILIPPLFGPIETDRRIPNARQLSFIEFSLKILKDFFHADGEGIGIPIATLENQKFLDIMTVMSRCGTDLPRLKRECELGIESGRNKESVLRLVRLLVEKTDSLSLQEKEAHKEWLQWVIEKRKEK
jgi:hypothetical protein